MNSFLPEEIRALIYSKLGQRDAKTLRTLGRKGNAAARNRGAHLTLEKRQARFRKGKGVYQGPLTADQAPHPGAWLANYSGAQWMWWMTEKRAHSNTGKINRAMSNALRNGASRVLPPPLGVAYRHKGKLMRATNGKYYESRYVPNSSRTTRFLNSQNNNYRGKGTYWWFPTQR